MTLAALGCICDIHARCAKRILAFSATDLDGSCGAEQGCVEVRFVALVTQHRLVGRQKIVGDGAMGRVADTAIFNNRVVFKDERTFFVLMAVEAEVVDPALCIELGLGGGMGVVAVDAAHFAFTHRVVGGQLEF